MPREATEILTDFISTAKFQTRFWRRVVRSDGCWDWTGQRTQRGYGQIEGMVSGRRHVWLIHRVVYNMGNGPIPEGMVVMHTCDNPSCCNPGHLRLGTQAENVSDALAKGRIARGFVGAWRGKKGAEHPRYCPADPEVIRLRFEEAYPPADISRITGHGLHRVRRWCREHLKATGQANRRRLRRRVLSVPTKNPISP